MATLLNGGIGSEPAEDTDIAPLVRRALQAQVHDQEPSPVVWASIRAHIARGQAQRRHHMQHWTTVTSVIVAGLLVSALGFQSLQVDQQPPLTMTAAPTLAPNPGVILPVYAEAESADQQTTTQPEQSPAPVLRTVDPAAPQAVAAPVSETPRIDYASDAPARVRGPVAPRPPQPASQPAPVLPTVGRGEPPKPI